MSPEILFWLALAIKMIVAAIFVVLATVTAERAGPVIGALIATLPISAGPAYVFLAFDHDASFIAASALTSLVMNAATAIYALIFVLLAQKDRLILSVPAGALVWLVLALTVRKMEWSLMEAAAVNVVVLPICYFVARPFRDVPVPRNPLRGIDLLLRALLVALLVAAVVTLSFRIGPGGTGILAVFPIIYTSIMIILHHRVGGRATAAVIANGFLGLTGFAIAVVTLHLTAVPLGTSVALTLALFVALLWNLGIYGARRRGIAA